MHGAGRVDFEVRFSIYLLHNIPSLCNIILIFANQIGVVRFFTFLLQSFE